MSFIYYNGSIIPRMELNKATSTYKRFTRFWGTETKQNAEGQNVKVYKEKAQFYTNAFRTGKVTKEFVKAIGMKWSEFIGQDIDSEIDTMYFYMKHGFKYSGERAFDSPVNTTIDFIDPTDQMICDTLNKEFEVDDEVDVTISYGGALKRYVSIHSLEFEVTGIGISPAVLNTKEIREVLASNPWYYYANSRHVEYDLDSKQFQLYDGSGTDVTSSGGTPTPRSTPVCSTASTVSYMGALALVDNGMLFVGLCMSLVSIVQEVYQLYLHNMHHTSFLHYVLC